MNGVKVNIKVYSDSSDITSIISVIKQLELKGFDISLMHGKRFVINPNDIIILQPDDIESKLLNKVIEVKNSTKNTILFVVKNNNALLVSLIAKFGFTDIFVFPYELSKFISHLEEIINNNSFLSHGSRNNTFEQSHDNFKSIIGNSIQLRKVIDLSKKVADKTDINLLIQGETGTGKGLLAKAIHKNSISGEFPFVDIVCTSIPDTLLESELFGFEPGAFTNAKNRKHGLFELAENGTLFLDEIGDLSVNLQTKLLRTIEKKVIRRLGGVKDVPINARIISATNKNLRMLIENNLFRRDLFHRLDVVSIELPPLRERGEDALLLTKYFINKYNGQFNKSVRKIDEDAEQFILRYPWPGNVRELKNAIERTVLLSENSTLKLRDFTNQSYLNLTEDSSQSSEVKLLPQIIRMDVNFHKVGIRELTKSYAKEVLKKSKGNKSQAAKLLGVSRPKLDALLKK